MTNLLVLLALVLNPLLVSQNLGLSNLVPNHSTAPAKKLMLPSMSNIIGKKAIQGCTIEGPRLAFGFTFPCGPVDGTCTPPSCDNCAKDAFILQLRGMLRNEHYDTFDRWELLRLLRSSHACYKCDLEFKSKWLQCQRRNFDANKFTK